MTSEPPETETPKPEGLRARKRQETLQRIAETGLRLFGERGYEATTLDAIAEAAGISRRTFFSYFRSKEEILLEWQMRGFSAQLRRAVLAQPADRAPIAVVRDAMLQLAAGIRAQEFISIDRVMRASETLQARKQATYALQERALHEALVERWPDPARSQALRLVAMVSLGAMRLAIEAWIQAGGDRGAAPFLEDAFAQIAAEVCGVGGPSPAA
ncbi:TetR/AcrR family transcriptional regulator [Methylobacterium frigidaeris]|uniref:HTH-type transcriptional regulator BetI n=1 Tax=Methylobacterium frigidaeris TaxID=2038277 RepID=A0AA37H8F3_9HYPH|nr:TetR/AcrR family transcriptional regulator [Methylobacterium frigidaeris]PIK73891.1 TetR family transcriptional regulator [Methylobacterium frigidaeris]GJD61033.1 HTH-type transcriptional regulator BetI [Methylobacterium frigidaeris]